MRIFLYLVLIVALCGYLYFGYLASGDPSVWRKRFGELDHPDWIEYFFNPPVLMVLWLPLLIYGNILIWTGGFRK